MKTVNLIILLICVLFLASCSGKKSEDSKASGNSTVASKAKAPVITGMSFDNEKPSAADFVRIIPEVNKERYPNGYTYYCRWFVNDTLVGQKPSIQLMKGKYKKGDTVYCKLKVISKTTKLESEEVESKEIEIINTPPTTRKPETDISFRPPGLFRYKIKAEDLDGDTLSYRLIGPLDRNLKLNTQTGQIEFELQAMPEKPMRIMVDISDGNGGSTIFTLNLQKQEQTMTFGEDPQ